MGSNPTTGTIVLNTLLPSSGQASGSNGSPRAVWIETEMRRGGSKKGAHASPAPFPSLVFRFDEKILDVHAQRAGDLAQGVDGARPEDGVPPGAVQRFRSDTGELPIDRDGLFRKPGERGTRRDRALPSPAAYPAPAGEAYPAASSVFRPRNRAKLPV